MTTILGMLSQDPGTAACSNGTIETNAKGEQTLLKSFTEYENATRGLVVSI